MIMTIPEAARTVCPNIRYCSNRKDTFERRDEPIYNHASCVGPGCAAWRWVEVNVVDAAFLAAVKRHAEEIGDKSPNRRDAAAKVAADREAFGLPMEPTRGYCGLAGIPHDLPRVLR